MPDASDRPTRCKQCGWGQAEPGNLVCDNCAIRILKETCTHPWRPELVILQTSNGYQHPQYRCRRCYKTLDGARVRDVEVDEADALIVNKPTGACAHCGRTDAIERHHWAPRHLFDDADEWPTSPLCPDCHRLWHVTTGTAGTSQPRAAKSRPTSTDERHTAPEVNPWTPVEGLFGGSF